MASDEVLRAIAKLGGPKGAADETGVNIRTLQRIAGGHSEASESLATLLCERAGVVRTARIAPDGLALLAGAIEGETKRHGAPPLLYALAELGRENQVPMAELRERMSRGGDSQSSRTLEAIRLLEKIGVVEVVDDVEKVGGPRSLKLVRLTTDGFRMLAGAGGEKG